MWSFQALTVFVILLPGFIARAVLAALAPRVKQSNFVIVIESFIFSFFIYAVTLTAYPSRAMSLLKYRDLIDYAAFVNDVRPLMYFTLILSVLTGLLLSYLLNHDLLHGLMRWLRATTNTSRSSTWLDVFTEMGNRHVIVTLGDGRRIQGYPEYCSNEQDESCVFLAYPSWISNEGKYISLEVRGILLAKSENISRVEFMLHEEEFDEQERKKQEDP